MTALTETAPDAPAPQSIPPRQKRRGPNSTLMLIGTQGGTAVFRLMGNVVTTRLLAPDDFGVAFLLTSVLFIIELATETGIPTYIVRKADVDNPRTLDALWTMQLLRGLAAALVLFLAAPLITSLVSQPLATDPLRLAALVLVLIGLRSHGPVLARRGREDWRNSLIEFGSYLFQIGLAVALSFALRNYWALVIPMVARHGFLLVASYALFPKPWRRFRIDRSLTAEVWQFSKFIFGSSVLTIFVTQFDKILVLKQFPLATVGFYNLALSLVLIFDQLAMSFSRRVYMAEVSARLRARDKATPHMFYQPMRIIRPALTFVAAGGVFFGETLYRLLYDDRYALAGTFFSVLIIRAILLASSTPAQAFLVANGGTRTRFTGDILRVIWLPVAAITGYAHFGQTGLLWAVALSEVPPIMYYYWRLGQQGILRLRSELIVIGALLAGLAAGALANLLIGPYV